jgi:two-component system NarL family response regulator
MPSTRGKGARGHGRVVPASAGPAIRVMVVEDHFVVRVGLVEVIHSQPDMAVVAEAKNGLDAIDLFRRHSPDVVLMDLRIPGLDGLGAMTSILEEWPAARIVVLSTFGGEEDIIRAIRAGARGYYLKDVGGEELIAAIRAVHAGERRLPLSVSSQIAERMSRPELTPREGEVLSLMVRGVADPAIATALGVSDRTVRVHVSNLAAKLGCSGRAHVVSEAFRQGFIHVDDDPPRRAT